MLVLSLRGAALSLVRHAETSGGMGNGLDAWRLLSHRYGPDASPRVVGLVQQTMDPSSLSSICCAFGG